MKLLKDKLIKVFCIILSIIAIWILISKYEIYFLIKAILRIIIFTTVYITLHELLHFAAAGIFSMKLICIHIFCFIFSYEEKRIKIIKDKIFDSAGSCFALPTWKNTEKQWLVLMITPVVGTLFLTVISGVIKGNSIELEFMLYMGMLFTLWSLIPFQGSDIYYMWLYIFKRSEFKAVFEGIQLGYGLIYGDINVPAYCGIEFPNLEPDNEIMQNWMGLHLEYAIILVMTKNYNAIGKNRKRYGAYLDYASEEYKILFEIFTCLLNENDHKIQHKISDISNMTYEEYFLRILSGEEKDVGELKEKIDKELMEFEQLGFKDAYKLKKQLYLDAANAVVY